MRIWDFDSQGENQVSKSLAKSREILEQNFN